MFQPVNPKVNFVQMEERILQLWQERKIFERSRQQREGAPEYVFYEGPPTANGKPGVHHVLARAFKDMFPRYKIMRGYHIIRRGGWDTHGLPVEIEVEKKLGFTNKRQIEAYGIEKFNQLCRESAFQYIRDWEKLTERIGFWVDLQTAYVTYTNDYIESLWWILKQFWDKGLIYEGFKVTPYCPRCGTPLSDHEVALGYQENTPDPSVFVRMRLLDRENTSLLVWTTTPWTLPANVAVAAHPQVNYVTVETALPNGDTERLILAEDLLQTVFGEQPYTVLERYTGENLQGLRYQPLFNFLTPDKPAHYVVLETFVTTGDGTGLVHMAPAFGAEDLQAAKNHNLPMLMTVKDDGTFIDEVTPWAGKFIKDADPEITRDLNERGLLFKDGIYLHTYPFCWRCSTPLLYYARVAWYIRTTAYKDRLVELNQQINWYPDHIKNGRFGNWLENNIDWAISRDRYWATPLPIWRCANETCDHQVCVGSVAELSQYAGRDLTGLELHRPYVDEVTFACEKCGATMHRVPALVDVWFDSGAMPVAQWHYPFENQAEFKRQFPADYICEAVDQTRGWFYSLHAISTLLFDSVAYKNVICLGLILDGNGFKMSKSRGNIVDPWDVLNTQGADAFRWYLYTASPPGQERRFSNELVYEVVRSFSLTLWNVYSFFVTYANLDGWQPNLQVQPEYSPLDRWLRSSLHALVRDVTHAYETYDVPGATRPIQEFVDVLSNWYLRRSRRRFWKSESDADKHAAYATLYEALVTLSKLLAPAMPFLADELYQNLVVSQDHAAPDSVHLADWQTYDPTLVDETLNREMLLVMKLVSLGHSARNKANIKVRQPLAEIAFAVPSVEEAHVIKTYADLLCDELNVKQVRALGAAGEAVSYSLNPLPKQLGQKYKSKMPAVRAAILALNPEAAARTLLDGNPLTVTVDGEALSIFPDEVDVRAEAKSGLVVASEGGYLAALDTTLTPELTREGLAREFVRRVQDLRKQADFDIADRIHARFVASPGLVEAVTAFREYIMAETLMLTLESAEPQAEDAVLTANFDGESVRVGLRRAG